MIIDPSLNRLQHLAKLLNEKSQANFSASDLSISSIVAQTPAAGNDNKNTQIVVAAASGGNAYGSGTFNYNRVDINQSRSWLTNDLSITGSLTHQQIDNLIAQKFGIVADDVVFMNPDGVPGPQKARSYLLYPFNSFLYLPTTRRVLVKNTSAFTPPSGLLFYLGDNLEPQDSVNIRNAVNNAALTVYGSTKYVLDTLDSQAFATYNSIYFNGTDSYLRIPSSIVGSLFSGSFTIDIIFKPDATSRVKQPLLSMWKNAADPIGFLWTIDGTSLSFYYKPYNLSSPAATTPIVLGKYSNLRFVRDGGLGAMYVNGVKLGGTMNLSSAMSDPNHDWIIGTNYDSAFNLPSSGSTPFATNLLKGNLKEIAIWNSAKVPYTAASYTPTNPLVS